MSSGSARPAEAGVEAPRAEPVEPRALRPFAAGPLAAIPVRHRLSTKLLGLSVVLAAGAVGVLALAELRMQRELLDQLARSSELLGQTLAVTTQDAMQAGRTAHAYDRLANAAVIEGIASIRVLDEGGRIVWSSAPHELGAVVPKDAPACAGCHAGPRPSARVPVSERTRVVATPAGRVMSVVVPVSNARGCATADCHVHPPGRQVLGMIDIGTSLVAVDRQLRGFRVKLLSIVGAALLGLVALLYVFGRIEVLEPVSALVEGTRRVARDDLDVEIRVHTKGELRVLADSFNDMTRSLRRLEDALNAVLGGLERQVEARTADLRAAQDQLVRTEKLSSLGKLSASIAHEINNPLAGILTFAKLVSRTLSEGPPDDARREKLLGNLALVEREAQRCSAIVKNLLDFARERPIVPKEIDPNAPIEEALSLIANQVSVLGVAVEKDLVELPAVHADFGQLRQAFVNIAMNACEAMGRGGKLTVRSRPVERVWAVEISFADTGPGIPAERLPRIFDPFFSTKEKGTGLGLSVVYGIVERHGGSIRVDSEVGTGTTFTIRLPCAKGEDLT
jgi:two-component system NtrC family sensor kinase